MFHVVHSLADDELHTATVQLAADERAITQKLLWHLREIERRRLYLDHGAESLFTYCTRVLKYSEGAAVRRVNASRLLEEAPDLSDKILDGSVNLSNLSIAQSFIKAEEKRTGAKLDSETKQEILSKVENTTQAEAERALAEMLPEAQIARDRTRPLGYEQTEITLVVSREFLAKYERVRELNSHKPDFLTASRLFEALLDEHLKRHAPENKSPRSNTAAVSPDVKAAASSELTAALGDITESASPNRMAGAPTKATAGRRIYISVAILQDLHRRSGGQCEHVDHAGRRCTRRYHLQVDHKTPLAHGGSNDLSNLQMLCRPHNLRKGSTLCSPGVLYACG